MSDPAIGLIELDSISAGIVAADSMVKTAPVGALYSGTVHPGKYLVLVSGDTASVDIAMSAGSEAGGSHVADQVFLPDVHPLVVSAMTGQPAGADLVGEALGIVETTTVAAAIDAADAGVKAADVGLAAIRIADGLGGKGYVLFSGSVAEIEAAVEAARDRLDQGQSLIRSDVIPQLHDEVAENVVADLGFLRRVRRS